MEDTNLSSGTQATTTIKFESEDLDEASPNPLQLRLLQIHPTAAIPLGMISHKKSLITIFGHKHKIKNFINFNSLRFWFICIWNKIANFESKLQ